MSQTPESPLLPHDPQPSLLLDPQGQTLALNPALAGRTQRMPLPQKRSLTRLLHAASVTPLPMGRCAARAAA